jgi:hypothetical protein
MIPPPVIRPRIVLAAAIGLSLIALALTFLAPGFSLDNGLVYGGF